MFSTQASVNDPIVMTVNGKGVPSSEFEYIWHKNSNVASDTLSVRQYADMFALFKMKVAAAEEAGIDTTKAFLDEWRGYRSQLTGDYLKDEDSEREVIAEAYRMSYTYTDASHILIQVGRYADPADTLEAYNKIMEVRKLALKKNADFAALAREYSSDGSKQDGGHLGVNIAGRYIYPFAKTLMQLKEGEISEPIRSQFGYHLILLHKRFEAPGQYVTAHIFKQAPLQSGEEAREKAHQAIMAIYDNLKAGMDFIQVATSSVNDDQYPKEHGGMYPAIDPGQMPYEYEKAVYGLKDGEYSEPFSTDYGWHIVKRISLEPLKSIQAMEKDLKAMIDHDERAETGRNGLAQKLKEEYAYTFNNKAFEAFCQAAKEHGKLDSELSDKVSSLGNIASFKDNTISAIDFAKFLQNGKYHIHYLSEAWNKYANLRILSYEDSQLEKKHPEFGHLMQEYHDGLLLFEISNREVWNKATTDKEGLKAYFEANKANYTWDEPRYKGVIIYCADPKMASKVKKAAKNLPTDSIFTVLRRTFNNDSTKLIKMERGLFKPGDNPVVDKLAFKQGDWTADEAFPVVWLQGKTLDAPEEVNDIRGAATTDYQQYLENQWIAKLREKYPVEIDEEAMKKIK